MPPRRSTRNQAKEEEKKKKDEMEEEEESEEEEEEKTTTRGRKAKAPAKKAPAKGKGRGKSKAAESEDEEEEESEEEEKPKGRATRGAAAKKTADKPKGKGKRGAAKSPEDSEEDEEEDDKKAPVKKTKGDDKVAVKKVVTKGGAAVDEHFEESDEVHVYQAGGVTYTKTLNQSNLSKNNNKFYIIQLLESDDKKTYWTYNRWGRVGYKGQTACWEYDAADRAIADFNKKLREKKGRGYIEIDINYDDDGDDKKDAAADASDEEDKRATPKKPARGRGKKDESEDEEEDDKKKAATPKKEDKQEEKKEAVKKVITKGGAAVDEYFDEKDCEVYMANGKVYAKTLNQSNLTHNNNKFYIIQILEKNGKFFVWNRWGRVGVKGQTMKKACGTAQAAIEEFEKKFHDKTVKGDYIEVEINYDDEKDTGADKGDEEEKDDKTDNKSKLPDQVKDLIKLIFDLKMMNNQMKEIGYDPSRMPLGKLSKNAIQKGYEVLKQLADAIEKKRSRDILNQLSSQFYSQIPHDMGFKQMSAFILDTDKKVKEKLEMLASLEDIQIATKLLDQGTGNSEDSLIDSNYKKLKCGLNPCPKDSDEFKMVVDYIKNTHGSTHSSFALELVDLFSVEREGEAERYTKDIHNKQLLWHGSRLTNYVGILSQGLRIAPPEAPVTGYMFGKGVYFADMVSKSANYCFTNAQNNTGIMLLCEVALGNCNEKLHADYNAATLPPGKHSTKGVGRNAPNAGGAKTVDGDVIVPMGKGETTNIQGGALLYNEFIVYDIKQIKIRYLLRLKFNYRYNY